MRGALVSEGPSASGVGGGRAVSPLNVEELLMWVEKMHVTALRHREDAQAQLERRSEELHQAQDAAQEAAADAQRQSVALPAAEDSAKESEERLGWLSDVLEHLERAQARQCFEGEVMEACCGAAAHLRRARELQGRRRQEADANLNKIREACEAGNQRRQVLDVSAVEAQVAVNRAQEAVRRAQLSVEKLADYAKAARSALRLESQVRELGCVAGKAEESLRDALERTSASKAELAQLERWEEELRAFFEGRGGSRDAGLDLCQGLQALAPPGDPLPLMLRALFSDTGRGLDVASPSAVSVRDLASEQLRAAGVQLRKHVASQQAACADREQEATETKRQLHRIEKQLEAALARVSSLSPKKIALPSPDLGDATMRPSGAGNCARIRAASPPKACRGFLPASLPLANQNASHCAGVGVAAGAATAVK